MRCRRSNKNLLVEPPTVATGDIAFNLIVFFLVCASVQPDSGRKQTLPRSEEKAKQEQQAKNVEVTLTRTTVSINGDLVPQREVPARLRSLLSGKPRPEDRVVVVKSRPDTPYAFWIDITGRVEEAGGTVTIQREEERTVQVGGGAP
ncbi:MAG: biopolymer transporter ExbD [Pirellulales bacterium]